MTQDQDGGSGSTRRDQDLDLKNCAEFVVFKSLGLHIPVARLGKLGDSEDVVVACGGYISQV